MQIAQIGLRKSEPIITALKEIGARHERSPAQVALAWATQFHGDAVVAIPGASSAQQARSNAGAMGLDLSADELARLDEVSRGYR